MKDALYAVNPNHVRSKKHSALIANYDVAKIKAMAERNMALYDRLPKAARQAVNEYGQLTAAVRCKSRRAVDKVLAVKAAYQRKLIRSASVRLGD